MDAVIEARVGGRWYERGETAAPAIEAACSPGNLCPVWFFHGISMPTGRYDPALNSELEIRSIAAGPGATRIELEHRKLDRYGGRRDEMREVLDKSGDWGQLLALFARLAEGAAP